MQIKEISKLEEMARQIRKDIIMMLAEAGSGHPGGSLSATDLMTVLYFNKLQHDPKNPEWEERDRVIFSKGHVCPLLYACLARSGYFPVEELNTLRKLHSRLDGHPCKTKGLPGVEVSSGSLGQGLSVGVGMALGLKKLKKDSEGEVQLALDNLCGILDYNKLQIDGWVEDVMGLEPLAEKWRAFRWNVIEIDGHSIKEILQAYDRAAVVKGTPSLILAHTIKGKGVSFMEDVAGWHGKAPTKEQAELALKELEITLSKEDIEDARA